MGVDGRGWQWMVVADVWRMPRRCSPEPALNTGGSFRKIGLFTNFTSVPAFFAGIFPSDWGREA